MTPAALAPELCSAFEPFGEQASEMVKSFALLLSLWGTRLPMRQRLVAAWFDPKGLASVLYGLIVLPGGHSPRAGHRRAGRPQAG